MKKINIKSKLDQIPKAISFVKKENPLTSLSQKKYISSLGTMESSIKVKSPLTAQQTITSFFKDFDVITNIFQIDDDTYSLCLEYTDINFSKASTSAQVDILMDWVDYLNSFNEKTHIQVVNAGTSIKTNDFKKDYVFPEEHENENLRKIAKEFNSRVHLTIGSDENVLENKRYLVLSQKAKSKQQAEKSLLDLINKTEDKFKKLESNLRIVPYTERLNMVYDLLNIDTCADHGYENLAEKAHAEDKTIYDVLSPNGEQAISFKHRDYVVIEDKKYLQVLYMNKYPKKSMTPRFYNRIISQDMNIITTLNIQPTNYAKSIKMISKKIAGMDAERYDKIKRSSRAKVPYNECPDRKLERRISDSLQFQNDIEKNKQKTFANNFLICIIANSKEEMDSNRTKLIEIGMEHHLELKPILWQQMEGLQHVLPFGHNTIQFQRTLTSEATGVNVPFDSKNLMHKHGLYYGMNLSTHKSLFVDRKKLNNGNGAILSPSGTGKSFNVKLTIEQIKLLYPKDDIIIIDPQDEYRLCVDACAGQNIEISNNSNNHINPFDLDMNYSLSDSEDADAVKEKVEYILSFIESLLDVPLTGGYKSIIDRCCNAVYEPYVKSGYKDTSLLPNLPLFYEVLKKQPESEAKDIALSIERYVNGSVDMFSKETNVDIKNKLVCFDISKLSQSMQATGYLVVLDHIMNRLAKNKSEGRYTWLFIDEFHLLLKNPYSADFISKIYKIARKLGGLPTIITQNIADVLNNEYGRNIITNSEFAILMKQSKLELSILSQIFNLSDTEKKYISNSPKGQGLLIYGNEIHPFKNEIPEDFYIYKLNETSSMSAVR